VATCRYQKYLTFKQATAEEVQTWKDTVMYFYKKVLFKKQDKVRPTDRGVALMKPSRLELANPACLLV
jgi:hypothetical protein